MQIAISILEHAVDEKLNLSAAIEVVGVANPAQTYYASLKITQSHNRPVDWSENTFVAFEVILQTRLYKNINIIIIHQILTDNLLAFLFKGVLCLRPS